MVRDNSATSAAIKVMCRTRNIPSTSTTQVLITNNSVIIIPHMTEIMINEYISMMLVPSIRRHPYHHRRQDHHPRDLLPA